MAQSMTLICLSRVMRSTQCPVIAAVSFSIHSPVSLIAEIWVIQQLFQKQYFLQK